MILSDLVVIVINKHTIINESTYVYLLSICSVLQMFHHTFIMFNTPHGRNRAIYFIGFFS